MVSTPGPAEPGFAPANGLQIAYETFGQRGDRPLIMVMGLGASMLNWHADLCTMLAGRGFFVIRFDNRDVGRSSHLSDAPPPDLQGAMTRGDTSTAAYSLDDMADDAFGLLDALGVPAAHVLGASLGGMIAQVMAARRPERVLSLTSIMSTPAPALTRPTREAAAVLMRPPAANREEAIARNLEAARVTGSPGYPADEDWRAEVAGQLWDLGVDPAGSNRQLLAIYASGDRTEAVRGIAVPTLVVHGDSDPLINLSAGQRTAELIEGAELLVIPGMGHDLPRQVWPVLADAVEALADRAPASGYLTDLGPLVLPPGHSVSIVVVSMVVVSMVQVSIVLRDVPRRPAGFLQVGPRVSVEPRVVPPAHDPGDDDGRGGDQQSEHRGEYSDGHDERLLGSLWLISRGPAYAPQGPAGRRRSAPLMSRLAGIPSHLGRVDRFRRREYPSRVRGIADPAVCDRSRRAFRRRA
jgi:pimeloyl-ACP methyl ester carboxylesterase